MKEPPLNLEEIKEAVEKIHRFATAGTCISSVTHEMNNHLGAIMAYAEMLQLETSPGEEAHRVLEKIIESVNLCSHLINGLNTLSKRKEELVTLVEVPEVIETVILLRKYYLKTKFITIEKDIPDKLQPIVVNLPKFQLALLYLLINAEENFNQDKTAREEKIIQISAKEMEKGIKIEIKDNGPPINEDTIKILFTPFITTKKEYHLGLGLYVAKKIVEEHEGTLEYSNKHSFIMWIPYDNPFSFHKARLNNHSEIR
ncbi:MAG: HAMP domain-containing histidine kinase [Candidatus Hydrogenedentes bacterium]|nr:HAMP domain-containing histidine kinase [Candidatus Hydrogenedentota bacterium]